MCPITFPSILTEEVVVKFDIGFLVWSPFQGNLSGWLTNSQNKCLLVSANNLFLSWETYNLMLCLTAIWRFRFALPRSVFYVFTQLGLFLHIVLQLLVPNHIYFLHTCGTRIRYKSSSKSRLENKIFVRWPKHKINVNLEGGSQVGSLARKFVHALHG